MALHGLCLVWAVGARPEITDILVGDVELGREDEEPILSFRDPKTNRASNPKPVPVRLAEGARPILVDLIANRPPDELLIPGWNPRKASTFIRKAAATLKWSKSYKWSVTHNLRHGAATRTMLEGRRTGTHRVQARLRVVASTAKHHAKAKAMETRKL